jgi:hypothetical protein
MSFATDCSSAGQILTWFTHPNIPKENKWEDGHFVAFVIAVSIKLFQLPVMLEYSFTIQNLVQMIIVHLVRKILDFLELEESWKHSRNPLLGPVLCQLPKIIEHLEV